MKTTSGPGTHARVWAALKPVLPEVDLSQCPGLVLVAPHPDDETFGLGGTAVRLRAAGVDVQVVAVTDGEAAFPDRSAATVSQLRRRELRCALDVLGLGEPTFLELPDGAVAQHEQRLASALVGILQDRPAGVWCAATWRADGHPDHEAVGRAAAAACLRAGAVLLEYPVWAWHWALPGDPALPWRRGRSIPLDDSVVERKIAAAQCFSSQFRGSPPVLPAQFLPRLLAVGEVVFQ